jgi:DNA ligase (NAD+)
VQKLFSAINARRKISLERFIYALGIRQVGEATAKRLARSYQSLDAFLGKAQFDDLIMIEDIGPSVAKDIMSFLQEPHNQAELKALLTEITVLEAEKIEAIASPIAGKTVVFTGKLEKLGRAEAKAMAERLGAKVASAVSAKTDFVVAGADAGSKLKAALELKVKILSEDEWLSFIS